MSSSKKVLRVYGCGGFGINIAKQYQDSEDSAIKTAYFDTSRSNLDVSNLPNSYLVADLDGSGKKRDLNVEAIRRHVTPALNQHVPGDFNLVVFSGSGGSGSVFGPLVVDELLGRGKIVIPILLGDTDSDIASKNTLKTIKTMSGLSEKHGVPISMIYQEITDGSQRRRADEIFHDSIIAIGKLAGLVGRTGSELDTMDLVNWLGYHRVTPHQAGLGLINILDTNARLEEQYEALSVASVYGSPDSDHGAVKAAYRTTGYSFNETTHPLHFVITQNGLHATAEQLQRKLEEHAQQASQVASQHVKLHTVKPAGDFLEL